MNGVGLGEKKDDQKSHGRAGDRMNRSSFLVVYLRLLEKYRLVPFLVK